MQPKKSSFKHSHSAVKVGKEMSDMSLNLTVNSDKYRQDALSRLGKVKVGWEKSK